MDAITFLKADHKTVEALFRKFEQAGRHAKKLKRKLADRMVRELAVHAVIEEQVFYPALRGRGELLEGEVLRALEEHHVTKWLLKELEDLTPEAERFEAKVWVLMENVRAHVSEEEKTLFPQVRKAFSPSELKEMAQALALAKKAAPTRPHPRAPDSPPGNLLAGAVSTVMDMGKDAVENVRRELRDLTPDLSRLTGRRPSKRSSKRRPGGTAQQKGDGAPRHAPA